MKPFQRAALERSMHLDDHNATGSPFEPPGKDLQEIIDEMESRERRLGLEEGWQQKVFPKVIPSGWRPLMRDPQGEMWVRQDGLKVLISAMAMQDDKRWLHVSCSRPRRLPSWEDLKRVKLIFIGRDRPAIQLLPAEARYINEHPFVLHLFSCLDGDALPDFTMGTGRI